MHQRGPIHLVLAGAFVVAAAYGLTIADAGTSVAPWAMALGATLVLTGLGLLGVGPNRPRLAAAVLVACACTCMGFVAGLLLAPPTAYAALFLGLPVPTTILLLVSGLVPLVLLPIAYALAFHTEVLGDG